MGEGMSHDNMGNHGVEKREVKSGLPSPEASQDLLAGHPLLTKGKGHTAWIGL